MTSNSKLAEMHNYIYAVLANKNQSYKKNQELASSKPKQNHTYKPLLHLSTKLARVIASHLTEHTGQVAANR